ncbi:hypothetical protein Tco_0046094 [Tanacetum coccineum]
MTREEHGYRKNGTIPEPTEEISNPCTTMEEYVQFENERALRNGEVYNWETAQYGKVNWCLDDVDVNVLIFFETKFPAIVYDDALILESDYSSELALNSDINLEMIHLCPNIVMKYKILRQKEKL